MISEMPLDIVLLLWIEAVTIFGAATAAALHEAPEIIEAVREEIAIGTWADEPKRLSPPRAEIGGGQ